MELRKKFFIITLMYLLALLANLVLAAWCIVVYFNSAFADFENELSRQRQIEEVRSLVRREAALLESGGPQTDQRHAEARHQLESALADLQRTLDDFAHHWPSIAQAVQAKDAIVRERLAELRSGTIRPLSQAETDRFVRLDEVLGELVRLLNLRRQIQMERAASTQSQVITILTVSACVGAVLCLVGLYWLRQWVIQPVANIREATRRISEGDFDYRLPVASTDELGRLSAEVNQMCSTIQSMQQRLIQQERLAAAAEMFARLAHNIRNPLGSIRGLAEATARQRPEDTETVECQRRIISTVDRFEKWLRDMQQSVSPMSLNLQAVCVRQPIESVATALGPLLDRRGVTLEIDIEREMGQVLLDAAHFEQGLAALVTNAIQASSPGQRVRIAAAPLPDGAGKWQIAVEDQGPGIPAEIRDRVFLPCFTTKADGQGLGLAMASKVVKIHGGDLTFETSCGRGTRFIAVFPGLLRERD